jgi:nucleoside-diphosphate-sugar epimerase
MRIFIAGATGAIGSRLLSLLIEGGHTVFGLTRSPGKSAMLEKLGARPVVADGLDGTAIREAVTSVRPDVVVHQMTDLREADYRHFDRAFAMSNRLRMEGTDHLLSAARAAGTSRFIAQSFCGWPYERRGGPVKTELDPLDPNPPREFRSTLAAIGYLERVVSNSVMPEGVILRYGVLYGPDTGMFEENMVEQIRRHRFPLIGTGGGWWSFLHVGDAARATVLAIERGSPGQIYNVVDDDPAPVREWLPVLANELGAKPPFHLPAWLARILAGEHVMVHMTEARAGSNAKAKRELGWQPAFSSWRQGFAVVARQQSNLRNAA